MIYLSHNKENQAIIQ